MSTGLDRDGLLDAVHKLLPRFFGVRRGRVVAANHALIECVYDRLIDVTGGVGVEHVAASLEGAE